MAFKIFINQQNTLEHRQSWSGAMLKRICSLN